MRLSDVKGDRVVDVIADVIDPIASIAEDEKAKELFSKKVLPEGMTPKQFLLKRVKAHLPEILRTHKGDFIAILATIEGVTPEEYAKGLDLVKLIRDCTELLTDEVFITFFTSLQSTEDVTSCGSAVEDTPGEA